MTKKKPESKNNRIDKMICKKLKFILGINKTKLGDYLSGHRYLKLIREDNIDYVYIDKLVGTDDIRDLLNVLRREKYQIDFHDHVHPTISDPGAYFSYSTEKSIDDNHWSMTCGNHGWSGGIYQITDFILARQIISLIKKEELTRIQISDATFVSHYDLKSEYDSIKKGSEIDEMHSKMTTKEIMNKISSRDSHQIWESTCEIIALGQDREALNPLLILTDKIHELTKGIELGGAFAPNSRFLTAAVKTLEFHRDSDACTCSLYGLHDCMNPKKEVDNGFLQLDNIVRVEDKWVDYYEASCTRCNQKFKIEEREGHYMWWKWEKITMPNTQYS